MSPLFGIWNKILRHPEQRQNHRLPKDPQATRNICGNSGAGYVLSSDPVLFAFLSKLCRMRAVVTL
jgi:hypothetical protein